MVISISELIFWDHIFDLLYVGIEITKVQLIHFIFNLEIFSIEINGSFK